MFVPDGELDKKSLHQGDVVSKIHILGAINLNGVTYSSNVDKKVVGWCVSAEPQYGDAIVLSHSCEVAEENGVKLTSVILAPLRDINKATDSAKIEELKKSNVIVEGTDTSFLKYFYIEPHAALTIKEGVVADFSKCFSVRKNSYQLLLSRKVAQLKPEVVSAFSMKLALYFHRDEIPAEKPKLQVIV